MTQQGQGANRPDLQAIVDDVLADPVLASLGELTPHRVAESIRRSGRPVGDATVLAVYEEARRRLRGGGGRFIVSIDPDDSVTIHWPLNQVTHPRAHESAILDRDSIASRALVTMLRTAREGGR